VLFLPAGVYVPSWGPFKYAVREETSDKVEDVDNSKNNEYDSPFYYVIFGYFRSGISMMPVMPVFFISHSRYNHPILGIVSVLKR